MTFDRMRLVFIGIIGLACVIMSVLGAVMFWYSSSDPNDTTVNGATGPTAAVSENAPPPAPSGEAIQIEVHSSSTKTDWMNQVTESFNTAGKTIANGQPIFVSTYHVGSGSSMTAILDGDIQPTVWSPGSQLWVTRLNQTWSDRKGQKIIRTDCPATLAEPLAIGMWEPMARALGWPDTPISWNDFADLSTNPDGWGAYDHPEWGQFKFGHGHPEHSNSGMLSLVAEVYAAAETTEGLTVADVKSDIVAQRVGGVEQNVFHYGKKSTDILTRMTQRGPDYLHALPAYESDVVKWNSEHSDELQFPLVTIYPSGGTFWVQNPYCILKADWVTPEQAEAAEIFRDYLLSPEQQAQTIQWGLRPADPSIKLESPIDLAHGAVPTISQKEIPHLPYPSDEVIDHVIDTWHQVKKKATVVLVLDISGSMTGDKIKQATRGAALFVEEMDPADEICAIAFNDKVVELACESAGGSAETLKSTIQGLFAGGGTALYEAVITSLDRIDEVKDKHDNATEPRIYGVVLLSDGRNEVEGGPSQADMLSRLPASSEASGVKIYTIAYGEDADNDLMATLANRTNGKKFEGSAEDIEDIYFLISSEF